MICVRSLQHTQMILHCCCEVTSVMSDSVRPHRRQPTRLPRPWDSPGKNTGVGFHFLLQCMKLKSESEVIQSCPTLSDPMDYSLPGSSIHGIFQARVLEWVAIAFSGFCISSCQRKTIALTIQTFVGKVMSLFFNMLSRFVIGEGNGTPLQYSCLENPMDGEAWWAAVHGVARSRTWLSNFTFTFHFPSLEKEMATHSSVIAWRISGTGEPGGLPSMGSHRVGHDWSDLAAAAAACTDGASLGAQG